MNIRCAALLGLALLSVGCASTSKVMLGQARAPVDPATVQIYSTPPDNLSALTLDYKEGGNETYILDKPATAAKEIEGAMNGVADVYGSLA